MESELDYRSLHLTSDDSDFVLEPCGYISDDLDNDDKPISCFKVPQLTAEEKARLLFGIKRFGPSNMERIAELLPGLNLLQISNLISTLDSLCPKSQPPPLRFGYPSNEDDTSVSSSRSSETISDISSSETEFSLERHQTNYDRTLMNLINWKLAIRKYYLPSGKDFETIALHIIHSFVNYIRELMRVITSFSSARRFRRGSNSGITEEIIKVALRHMPSIFQHQIDQPMSSSDCFETGSMSE